jgi:serine/threonine protein kinase
MEYIEGESLEQRLTKGPVPPPQALAYAIQIADALDITPPQPVFIPRKKN